MRLIFLTCSLILAVQAGAAAEGVPSVPELLRAEAWADRQCRGTTDDLVRDEQCALRERLVGRLSQAGYCWGLEGQTEGQKQWHRCGPRSIRIDDTAAAGR